MDADRYHALLLVDGDRLRGVAATADLAAPVPTCPGWTVGEAVAHTAEVYEHKLACIAAAGARPDPWPPVWPDRDPVAWFADAHARLLAVLRTTDPGAPSWTWWPPDRTAGFWTRRMAHETAVHRADVESAVGRIGPVAEDLAVDGVDEVLLEMVEGDWSSEPQPGSVGAVAVTAGGRRFRVVMTPDRVTVVEDEPGPVDVEVGGDASAVDLWLWGRLGTDAVTVSGDPEVLARFRARMACATQ